jgi:hypothetical protein
MNFSRGKKIKGPGSKKKNTSFKRTKGTYNTSRNNFAGRKPKKEINLPNAPVPEFLPVLTSDISDITPDELMFAYSWAKYPNTPQKALQECGIQVQGKQRKELLQELISSIPVQKAFREALLNRIQALKATNDKSKKYLSCMAYLDKGDAFDKDGKLMSLVNMPFHVRVCVQEYEEKEVFPVKGSPYIIRKVKFVDSKDALKTLMSDTGSAGKEMAKLLGSNNTFIQNITNNNIIGSGNTYNTLVQNKLDLGKLSPPEMDILFKALGINADTKALEATSQVQDIIDVETQDYDDRNLQAIKEEELEENVKEY